VVGNRNHTQSAMNSDTYVLRSFSPRLQLPFLTWCALNPHMLMSSSSRVYIWSCDLVRLRTLEVHSRGKMKLDYEINILQFFW